jgi:hypothetical protein
MKNKKIINMEQYQNSPRTRRSSGGDEYIVSRTAVAYDREASYMAGIEEKDTNPLIKLLRRVQSVRLQDAELMAMMTRRAPLLEQAETELTETIFADYVTGTENETPIKELDWKTDLKDGWKWSIKPSNFIKLMIGSVILYVGYSYIMPVFADAPETTVNVEESVNTDDPKAQMEG